MVPCDERALNVRPLVQTVCLTELRILAANRFTYCSLQRIHFPCFQPIRKTKGETRMCFNLVWNTFIVLLFCFEASTVRVEIDYSFHVPERFGEATVESADCCPYGVLPNNDTDGRIAPSFYGIGTQKGGTSLVLRQTLLYVFISFIKEQLRCTHTWWNIH